MFTPIADDDYRATLANLAGGERVTTGRLVPYCLVADPEFTHVGSSEKRSARHWRLSSPVPHPDGGRFGFRAALVIVSLAGASHEPWSATHRPTPPHCWCSFL